MNKEKIINSQVKSDAYNNNKNRYDEETSVLSQINETHDKLVKENRSYIKVIARSLLFTAVQGIAQRSHDEKKNSLNRGTFLELLHLLAEYNADLSNKLKILPQNATY